ncbi:hypothetical protein [Amycolatopsis sp. NPDC049159]|uniref:hypothetical protein n=1 Tax=Amycolatopsis sp. NPDC049159 TaxID=3157210 RepID=UPI0033F6ECF0
MTVHFGRRLAVAVLRLAGVLVATPAKAAVPGRITNIGCQCLEAPAAPRVQLWSCTGPAQTWTLPAADGPCPPGPFGSPPPANHLSATKIRGGFTFLEGPMWDKASQALLLTKTRPEDLPLPGERRWEHGCAQRFRVTGRNGRRHDRLRG